MKSLFTKFYVYALALMFLMVHAANAQLGEGWVSQTLTKRIHLDDVEGLQTFTWTSYKSVCGDPMCADYRYESEINTETFRIFDSRSNRSEIRLQNEYSNGSRQFEGYVTFYPPLNDESLMQIFGSTSGATQMMLRGYAADGGSIRGAGKTVAKNIYGKEVRVNVIHLQEDAGNKIQIYIDGEKMAEIADNEAVTNYHKYGCYGTTSGNVPAVVKWRNTRFFKDGRSPGTTVSAAITSPVSGSIFNSPANITINATATDDVNQVTKVQFYNGSTKIGEDLTSPYSFTWSNVAPGTHTIQATATNSAGQVSLPAKVTVTVKGSSFDITDNGGTITAQFANTSKPTENFPSLIDNSILTKYFISNKTALWVQYQSTTPAIVVRYTITSGNDVVERDPKNWNLQGSNNGTSWVTLDTRSNETFSSRRQTRSFSFENTTPYVYYRLNITGNNGAPGTQFSELELWERRNQTITFDDIEAKTYGDDPFELVATSSSGLPVTFNLESGPATLDGNVLIITGTGTVSVSASQAGNQNYFAAPSVVKSFIVNKAAQHLELDSIGTKTYGDAPFEITATTDTEVPVVFEVISGPATISGSTLTITGAGEVTVRATQAETENYLAAAAERTFTVNKAPQIIIFSTIETKTYGDEPFGLIATVATGFPLMFEVISGPATIDGITLTITGAGEVTVRVSQAGNENYLPAYVDQTFTVNKAAQIITFEDILPKHILDVVELSATSSSGLPVVYDVISGAGVLSGNLLSFSDDGFAVIEASQPGNENYLPASTVQQFILVYTDDSKQDDIKLVVHPNPTRGWLKVKLDNKKDKQYSFAIYDDHGNIIMSTLVPKSHKMFEIDCDITESYNGVYYLWASDGTQVTVRRIIKE